MVEHRTHNPLVPGSSPGGPTHFRLVAMEGLKPATLIQDLIFYLWTIDGLNDRLFHHWWFLCIGAH